MNTYTLPQLNGTRSPLSAPPFVEHQHLLITVLHCTGLWKPLQSQLGIHPSTDPIFNNCCRSSKQGPAGGSEGGSPVWNTRAHNSLERHRIIWFV